MVLLTGGLTPIASRLFLDVLALLSLCYCTFSSTTKATNGLVLVVTCFLTLATAGMTCRWTLTFPMIPIVILQATRRLTIFNGRWATISIMILTTLLIAVAALLTILFPAVQLPPIKGEFNVGMIKLHLPVSTSVAPDDTCGDNATDSFVSARILYPTLEEPKSLPYLDPETALEFCKESMAFGAPPPLKEFGWIMHNWRLIQMPMTQNAKPLQRSNLPLIVYSHGLGGNSIMYTYQTQHLAAQGYVVLVLDHTDGSAPVVQRHDGTKQVYNYRIGQLSKDGKHVDYVRERRAQADHRVMEMISSTIAFSKLNQENIPQLESLGVSFVKSLNTSDVHFMGHSFGATTALAAASRRPDLVSSVIAHEPATDWLPDDSRRLLFAQDKLDGGPEYSGGTGGFQVTEEKKSEASASHQSKSLHDLPMLFLYSDEWSEKKWGGSHLVEFMHKSGALGGLSEFGVIGDARHNEFSDACMITPLWLARSVGITGKRNPRDTAEEIKERTLDFLSMVRSHESQT